MSPVLEAWHHYRSYVDASDGDGEDGGGATGEIDELLEVIDLLSPLGPPPFDADGSGAGPPLGDAGALAPVLLSLVHLQLASDAVGRGLGGGDGGTGDGDDGTAQSSPDHHFAESLGYWPTNPAALSLLANYRRMNASPVGEVCDLYARAEGCAARWRDAALAFLRRSECEPEGEEREGWEAVVDPREWVDQHPFGKRGFTMMLMIKLQSFLSTVLQVYLAISSVSTGALKTGHSNHYRWNLHLSRKRICDHSTANKTLLIICLA